MGLRLWSSVDEWWQQGVSHYWFGHPHPPRPWVWQRVFNGGNSAQIPSSGTKECCAGVVSKRGVLCTHKHKMDGSDSGILFSFNTINKVRYTCCDLHFCSMVLCFSWVALGTASQEAVEWFGSLPLRPGISNLASLLPTMVDLSLTSTELELWCFLLWLKFCSVTK